MRDWCREFETKLMTLLAPHGFEVHAHWYVDELWDQYLDDKVTYDEVRSHPDAEPEFIIVWPDCNGAHVRVIMGLEDSGDEAGRRYMFWSACVQGAGGLQIDSEWDTDLDEFARTVADVCRQWRYFINNLVAPDPKPYEWPKSYDMNNPEHVKIIRENALRKLTAKEKQALGLTSG